MKKYLVGGAVRDKIMGFEPKDRDWVVVGSTREEMLSLGFTEVGKGFPVFMSSDAEEYALARKDIKVTNGYRGFESVFDPSVTLEEDLQRRDLTINSIAMTECGTFIDPMNGQQDIKDKVLRHVNLDDDPLRVLRIARFLSRFGNDWTVNPDTMSYCKNMKDSEFLALPNERVYLEMAKAIMSDTPRRFFDFLRDIGKLELFFPEIYVMLDCQENPKWHPEGNTYEHTMLVLQAAANRNANLRVRIAALVHDMGKPLVRPTEGRIGFFPGHESLVDNAKSFLERFSLVNPFYIKATRNHMKLHQIGVMRDQKFMEMVYGLDTRNNFVYLSDLAELGECDNKGRLGSENSDDVGIFEYLKPYHDAIANTKFEPGQFIGKNGQQCAQIRMSAFLKTYRMNNGKP